MSYAVRNPSITFPNSTLSMLMFLNQPKLMPESCHLIRYDMTEVTRNPLLTFLTVTPVTHAKPFAMGFGSSPTPTTYACPGPRVAFLRRSLTPIQDLHFHHLILSFTYQPWTRLAFAYRTWKSAIILHTVRHHPIVRVLR